MMLANLPVGHDGSPTLSAEVVRWMIAVRIDTCDPVGALGSVSTASGSERHIDPVVHSISCTL